MADKLASFSEGARYELKQKFHGWLKSMIRNYTEEKWLELGGKVKDVIARGTSSNAYDGSGTVKRDKTNYALATFSNGKRYNCDLSVSYKTLINNLPESKYNNNERIKIFSPNDRSLHGLTL